MEVGVSGSGTHLKLAQRDAKVIRQFLLVGRAQKYLVYVPQGPRSPDRNELAKMMDWVEGMLSDCESFLHKQKQIRSRRDKPQDPNIDTFLDWALYLYWRAGGNVPTSGGNANIPGPSQRFLEALLKPLEKTSEYLGKKITAVGLLNHTRRIATKGAGLGMTFTALQNVNKLSNN